METILSYLKRRLREIGPSRWEAIALHCGVAKSLPRKLAYDDRDNPGIQTIQPLLTYLQRVDSGEESLPADKVKSAA